MREEEEEVGRHVCGDLFRRYPHKKSLDKKSRKIRKSVERVIVGVRVLGKLLWTFF